MSSPQDIAKKSLDDFEYIVGDPVKKVKQLVRKITHSGETDLDKEDLNELKKICKVSQDDLIVHIYKECNKHLHKSHSQVRVSTVKLLDYLFQKSHVLREKLLNNFDVFLELTLAITQRKKVQLKLPPPKKFAELLKELTAKCIHKWQSDFGGGYEKLRYAYRFLREHNLVDFSRFHVNTREQLIRQQRLAEQQERILTRAIENRLRELRELKPQIEDLLAQIQSLIDILVPEHDDSLETGALNAQEAEDGQRANMQQHGIAHITQNIEIEFSPYIEVRKNEDNKELVQRLKELKKELIDGKLIKLVAIEKTINKRSDQMVSTLREIIDLKNSATSVVLKLSELSIVNEESLSADESKKSKKNKSVTLDTVDSGSDDDEFDEVQPKEGLETYIPKSLRSEYGLEPIDPRELQGDSGSLRLTDDDRAIFGDTCQPSTSKGSELVLTCNVRLESGKLCPRRDKVKCPFHGKIIARDHLGVPLDERDRLEEEKRKKTKRDSRVPEWQDPQLLADIKAATGIDLTMPQKGRTKNSPRKNLANPRTCDLTPKQRLSRKLKLMMK